MNDKPCNRHYHPDLGELFDKLTILQLKEVKRIGDIKKQTTKDIWDIVHDINIILNSEEGRTKQITGEFLRDIIVLAQMNTHIWYNEDAARKGNPGDILPLTHSLNGLRSEAVNRLQRLLNGRIDKKIDCLANTMVDEFKEQWTPSGY